MSESNQPPSTPTMATTDGILGIEDSSRHTPLGLPPLPIITPTKIPEHRDHNTPSGASPVQTSRHRKTPSVSRSVNGSPSKQIPRGLLSAFGLRNVTTSFSRAAAAPQIPNDSAPSTTGPVMDDLASVRSLRSVRSYGNISLAPTFVRGTGNNKKSTNTATTDNHDAGGSWIGEMLRMQDTTTDWRIEDWQQQSGMGSAPVEDNITFPADDEFERAFPREFDEVEGTGQDDDRKAMVQQWKSKLKHFIIIGSDGKVVWSRHEADQQEFKSAAVILALVSLHEVPDKSPSGEPGDSVIFKGFAADDGAIRVSVLSRGNLYLMAISRLGETDIQLRMQLEHLYMQILSTLSLTTMMRMFEKHPSADLRRPLQGTESILSALADGFTRGSPSTLLAALECLKLRATHRKQIDQTFLHLRVPELLYGLIVAGGKLVSVVRPRQHSLHPGDLHLIFNLLFESGNVKTTEGSSWIPICLPGFNSKGFLHMYTSFVHLDDDAGDGKASQERPAAVKKGSSSVPRAEPENGDAPTTDTNINDAGSPSNQDPGSPARSILLNDSSAPYDAEAMDKSVAIILISASGEMDTFASLHRMAEKLISRLKAKGGGLEHIAAAVRTGRPSCTDLVPTTTIKHFLYKSKAHVQFMMPSMRSSRSSPSAAASYKNDHHHHHHSNIDFTTLTDRRRLFNVYSHLNGILHTTPKMAVPRLCHVTSREYLGLVWATPRFEFYAVAAPPSTTTATTTTGGGDRDGGGDGITGRRNAEARDRLAKDAARMVDVIRKDEGRVFLVGGAVF